MRTPRWQRALLTTAVAALGIWRALGPLAGSAPKTEDTWFGDVCKQSTLSTCSAAAAATALRSLGIDASESEMARLCLTREAGTTTLGVYRGLAIKTRNTLYRVEPFTGTLEELLRLPPAPTVASIGVTTRGDGHSPVAALLPGAAHSVVILGPLPDGRVDVADPYTGRHQHLTVKSLSASWTGDALRIVPAAEARR